MAILAAWIVWLCPATSQAQMPGYGAGPPGTSVGHAPGFPFARSAPLGPQYVPGTRTGHHADYPGAAGVDAPAPIAHQPGAYGPPPQFIEGPDITAAPPIDLSNENRPNAFDFRGPRYYEEPDGYSSVSVDLLILHNTFDRNPAFNTNIPGLFADTENGDVSFLYGVNVVPRINFDFRFNPYFGVRGSWARYDASAKGISFVNSNPNARILSVSPVSGGFLTEEITVATDITSLNEAGVTIPNASTTTTNTLVDQGALFVESPREFLFPSRIPFVTAQDGQLVPRLPVTSGVQAGFPDILNFTSGIVVETYDLDMYAAIQAGPVSGLFAVGVRYGYLSHSYSAIRIGEGGRIAGFATDPFDLTVNADGVFDVQVDRETLSYGHNFGGVGPRAAFEFRQNIGQVLHAYSKFGGAILFGNRREVAFVERQETVLAFDNNNVPNSEILFDTSIRGDIVAKEEDNFTVVPVGEAEVGFELTPGPGKVIPVLRCGFFVQGWANGGNATNPNANLLLYGVNATFGIGF